MTTPPDILINLLQSDTKKQHAPAEMLIVVLLTVIFTIISLALYFHQAERVAAEKEKNRRLQAELLRYGSAKAALTLNLNSAEQLGSKRGMVNELKEQGIPAGAILDDIEGAMPEETVLVSLNLTDTRVLIKGRAADYAAVARLAASLKGSSHFEEIVVLSAQREPKDQQVYFILEMPWKGGRP
jgi:Tfp pilus assembly protein PilN